MLVLTRLAQRLLTLQPGHSLISPKLTLPVCVQRTVRSVGSSVSITLHAATQARRPLALSAVGLPSSNESHPMDHDSNSSGHAVLQDPDYDPDTGTFSEQLRPPLLHMLCSYTYTCRVTIVGFSVTSYG